MFKSFKLNDDRENIKSFINKILKHTSLQFHGYTDSRHDDDGYTYVSMYIENVLNGDMYHINTRSKLVTEWKKSDGIALIKASSNRLYEINNNGKWDKFDWVSRVALFENLLSVEPQYNDSALEC
jgi:hypothetical protein